MAPTTTDDKTDDTPAPRRGEVHRHAVKQPDGSEKHQFLLILTDPDPDDDGTVRAWPLGYEHDAARFHPHQLHRG